MWECQKSWMVRVTQPCSIYDGADRGHTGGKPVTFIASISFFILDHDSSPIDELMSGN